MRRKIIIYGLPMWLEERESGIPLIGGFWSFMLDILPFNGVIAVYTGSYLLALWHWLFMERKFKEN